MAPFALLANPPSNQGIYDRKTEMVEIVATGECVGILHSKGLHFSFSFLGSKKKKSRVYVDKSYMSFFLNSVVGALVKLIRSEDNTFHGTLKMEEWCVLIKLL